MPRLPVIPTIIVAIAVAVMITLGFWQLQRKDEKEAAIATLAANADKPAVAYPELAPLKKSLTFRKSSVTCLSVASYDVEAGKADDGETGFRYIANCPTSAEGPGARVVIGVGGKPDLNPKWSGGHVEGTIVPARDERNFIARVTGRGTAPGPMLLASKGLAGLKTPSVPSADTLPNSHLSYAVQWFAFAVIALVIYLLAIVRKSARHEDDDS